MSAYRVLAAALCMQSVFVLAACSAASALQRGGIPSTTAALASQPQQQSQRCLQPRVLCFSGSSRKESLNKKLAMLACKVAQRRGATATFIDLTDFDMPIYNGDDEAKHGLPAAAVRFKSLLQQHDALIIASPEYNALPTPLLLNTLDWASLSGRTKERHAAAFAGKTAFIVAASPTFMGGLRSAMHLRPLLGDLRVVVAPRSFALPRARTAFNEEGELIDDKQRNKLEMMINGFVDLSTKQLQDSCSR